MKGNIMKMDKIADMVGEEAIMAVGIGYLGDKVSKNIFGRQRSVKRSCCSTAISFLIGAVASSTVCVVGAVKENQDIIKGIIQTSPEAAKIVIPMAVAAGAVGLVISLFKEE